MDGVLAHISMTNSTAERLVKTIKRTVKISVVPNLGDSEVMFCIPPYHEITPELYAEYHPNLHGKLCHFYRSLCHTSNFWILDKDCIPIRPGL